MEEISGIWGVVRRVFRSFPRDGPQARVGVGLRCVRKRIGLRLRALLLEIP